MNAIEWAIVAGALLWLALAQNGVMPGPRALLRTLAGERHAPEVDEQPLPFCGGCPDHEACTTGGCYLDGGSIHPESIVELQCPDGNECRHGGRHWGASDMANAGERKGLDDGDILSDSHESLRYVDVSHNDYATTAHKARIAAEQAVNEIEGIDLSHLKGASPTERQEWVESWHRARPEIPRSRLAHILSQAAEIKIRQAQYDVRKALGPVR